MGAAPAGAGRFHERDASRGVVLFIESNTSGTGRLFVQTARGMGYRPVLVTARPEKYAYLSQAGAPEVIRVPRADEERCTR